MISISKIRNKVKFKYKNWTLLGVAINYHLSVRWLPLDSGDEGFDPDEVEDEMHDEGHNQVLVN